MRYKFMAYKRDFETQIFPHLEKIESEGGDKIRSNLLRDKINELTEVVRTMNPEKISPAWIARNTSLRSFFENQFRLQPDLISWQLLVDLLPKDLKDKWEYKPSHIHHEKDAGEIALELEALLEEFQPETFNKNWIITTKQKIYTHISRYFRDPATKKIRWDEIIEKLPEKWQSQWRIGRRDEMTRKIKAETKKFNFDQAIDRLDSLLKEYNPDTFSPVSIEKWDRNLYRHFYTYVLNEKGEVDWNRIISGLDSQFQNKFKKADLRTPDKAIAELNSLLEKRKPATFNSNFIQKENPGLADYLRKNFRNSNGSINWDEIISRLKPEFQSRFKKPKKLENYLPKNTYEDKQEVTDLMEDNREKLFTFFGTFGPDDDKKRKEICTEFIKLIKKGNLVAKEKFLTFLHILVNDWLDNVKDLSIYKHSPEVLEDKIEKCIYYYNTDDNTSPFTTYLYTSLLNNSQSLKEETKIIELDKPAYEGSREEVGGKFY